MLALLLSLSAKLPSLGILFNTIEKSLGDVLVFTTIFLLIFYVFVVLCHVSFGYQAFAFHDRAISIITCFTMMLGEYPYTAMFKANPQVSAITLLLFVFIINFMIINMYSAIVIRTYNKLQARQLFLGESMAKMLEKDTKKRLNRCYDLITC